MSIKYELYRAIVASILIDNINRKHGIVDMLAILDKDKIIKNSKLKNLIQAEMNMNRFNINPIKIPEDMDQECIIPYEIINSFPGLHTFSSCCGHNNDKFEICFYSNNIDSLFFLKSCVTENYWEHGNMWEITLETSDVLLEVEKENSPILPIFYCLRSKTTWLEDNQKTLLDLKRSVESHLNGFSFLENYNLWDIANQMISKHALADEYKLDLIIQKINNKYDEVNNSFTTGA